MKCIKRPGPRDIHVTRPFPPIFEKGVNLARYGDVYLAPGLPFAQTFLFIET